MDVSATLVQIGQRFRDLTGAEPAGWVHKWQRGSDNWHRRTHKEFLGSVMFWWSGESVSSGRGALMCYYPGDCGFHGWYAGFMGGEEWRATECVEISPENLAGLGRAEV